MKKKLDAKHEEALRAQVIDGLRPGSLLHDFALVLDYVGEKGVKAGGKHNLLPLEAIPTLDPKLARPLNLDLKRPQMRSHPYLMGLHLLSRASGLVRAEGKGDTARLSLDPQTKRSWYGLNDVERYFALLEAWLIVSRGAMVGEGRSWELSLLSEIGMFAEILRERGDGDVPLPPGLIRETYQLALLELFGWLRPKKPITKEDRYAAVRHSSLTPFGEAVLRVLGTADVPEEDDLDEDEVSDEVLAFGQFQPLFRPYFPAWQNNLVIGSSAGNPEGVYVWKVTFARRKVWRLIALNHDQTLDDLLYAILRAIDFDDDHLYEFRYRDPLGREMAALDPRAEDGMPADEVTVGSLPLKVGDSMALTYDFGDDWRFDVKLERIDPPGSVKKLPKVLESHGKAPEQYPDWEE